MEWISVEDKLPEDDQHVIVWDLRSNVYPFRSDKKGDDGKGHYSCGDAIFQDRMVDVNENKDWYIKKWGSIDNYFRDNPKRYRWSGQGPCSFDEVTHWMPLPEPPKETE